MAELNADAPCEPVAAPCCEPDARASCCEPDAKDACCPPATGVVDRPPPSCGCRA